MPGGEGEGCSPALKPVEFSWPELRPVWCQWLLFSTSLFVTPYVYTCYPVLVPLLHFGARLPFWFLRSQRREALPQEGSQPELPQP